MGAYGAALYAMNKCKGEGKSTIIKREALNGFFHKIVTTNCGLCNNNCRLTVNTFSDGKRYIAGNRCERPITKNPLIIALTSMNIREIFLIAISL